MHDSPGDAPAEMLFNNFLSGSGGVTIDNTGYEQWGTAVFNVDNSYTGATNINDGRLVITTANGLGTGTAPVTIGQTAAGGGALAIGGAGNNPSGSITITKPLIITRSDYSSAPDFQHYSDAIISSNAGPQHTVTINDLTINSVDGRIAAFTSTINLPNPVKQGAGTTAAVLDLDGDFAGTINLGGTQNLVKGGIAVRGGVEVNVTSLANLGGAGGTLSMYGGLIHPVGGAFSDINSLNIGNPTTWGGGFDVDAGSTFTVNQTLSGSALGKRGLGVLNIGGANSLTGSQNYYDAGTVNFTNAGTTTLHSIHMRSAVLNLGVGTIVTTNQYSSIGQDSTGTNGGPDKSTINIFGTGALVMGNADFNVSDNPNTAGTINVSGNGQLITNGISFIGKQTGAVGMVNQSGGTITINRNGNFAFILGDGRGSQGPVGIYNLSGGVFNSAGEVYVGEGNNTNVPATGTWTQSGGTATINNWFVIGREGAAGTMTLSGNAVLNHQGGNFIDGDSNSAAGAVDLLTLGGNSVLNNNTGEFWVGQGGSRATLVLQNNATLNTNDWLAVGRGGGTGTITMTGGTLNRTNSSNQNSWFTIGSNGTGTVNVSGGTLTSAQSFIGEATPGTLNISGGQVNLNGATYVRLQTGATGNLTVSGGTLTSNGTITNAGNIAFTGGVENLGVINAGTAATGAGSINVSGTALASAVSVAQPLVNLSGSSKLSIKVNGSSLSQITTLSITSPSKLDLNDNDLIVGTGTTKTAVEGYVRTARAGGQWTGSGITTSQALPTGAVLSPKGLGVVSGAEYLSVAPSNTTFDGVAVNSTDTIVKFTWNGDADLSGRVNADDYGHIDGGYQNQNTAGFTFDWFHGDFDYSGKIDANDYALIDSAYQQQNGTLREAVAAMETGVMPTGNLPDSLQEVVNHYGEFGTAYASAFVNISVPEPTTLGVIGIATASLLKRRRRSQNLNG